MSVAEKELIVSANNVIIAENVPKVFNAGQLSVISQSEALKGYASGSSVTIKDISPVEHDVPCKVGSKNLFDKNNANIIVGMFSNSGEAISPASTTRSVYISCKPNTTYTISKMATARFFGGFTSEIPKENVIVQNVVNGGSGTKITITSASDSKYLIIYLYHSLHDTAITLEKILDSLQVEVGTTATAYTPHIEDISTVKVQRLGKNLFDKNNANIVNGWFATTNEVISATDITKSVYIPCLPNTIYTASKTASARFYIGFSSTIPKAGETVENIVGNNNLSVVTSTSPSNAMYLVVWCYHANYDITITFEQILDSLQIEIGSMATEFEPYIEPVEFNVDTSGNVQGNTYLYPSMTLMTDTEGVTISAEYIKDIDKTFNSLTTAVALTGGE